MLKRKRRWNNKLIDINGLVTKEMKTTCLGYKPLSCHLRVRAYVSQTLRDPMGFPQTRTWTGLPFLSPVGLPNPGIEPTSPALAGGFFYHCVTWEARGRSRIREEGWGTV